MYKFGDTLLSFYTDFAKLNYFQSKILLKAEYFHDISGHTFPLKEVT